MNNRFVNLSRVTALREGEIPFRKVLLLIDGKWQLTSEDQYMRFMADDPKYVKDNKFAKQWLKETEKERDREYPIRACSECLFCYCVLNEEGIVSHWSCTMDNRLRTKDILARHKKCPIMDKGE